MEYEFEGSTNMPDLAFDDTALTAGDQVYEYDKIANIRITHDSLFSVYGILEVIYKGKLISIPFPKKHRTQLKKAVQKVKDLKNDPKKPRGTSDPYEEVKKLKELLDLGIITKEEFESKKKELL
ncbi:MAG: SHOCT domain-containing protein, partial [Erysipelotrichaceae bacterium]|nr:SHOCT domain-containing protein [Erysipelotrichaceae bacterium]